MAKQGAPGGTGDRGDRLLRAGTLGVIVMTFFAADDRTVAIRFGPPENFALMVARHRLHAFMITGSPVRRSDVALGYPRCRGWHRRRQRPRALTFGLGRSSAGIELLAVVIGCSE